MTLPKSFGLARWIAEGDPAGETWSGQEWGWSLGGTPPKDLRVGDRIYVVCTGRLRGYAPLVRIERAGYRYTLVRGGGAEAVTIDKTILGFRGPRYRWWARESEQPFPEWRTA